MLSKKQAQRDPSRHPPRQGVLRLPRLSHVLVAFLCGIPLLSPSPLMASQSQGRWKGPYSLENLPWAKPQATHLALLRGQADTSIVLYWRDPTEAWVVPIPDGTYAPQPEYFNTRAKVPVLFNTDIFCAGHSSIDGKLLVTGGVQIGTPGPETALVFDPKKYSTPATGTPPHGWATTDDMRHGRYYPSQVSLGAAGAITFSGTYYYEMMTLGGEKPSGPSFVLTDSMVPLALTKDTFWNARHPHVGYPTLAQGPGPRRDHTASFSRSILRPENDVRGIVAVYGGRTESTTLNELWMAWRTAFDPHENWDWQQATENHGPGTPPARSQHGAVVNEQWNKQYTSPAAAVDTLAVFIFGGLDGNSAVSDEVWLFRYYKKFGTNDHCFSTTRLATIGEGPGARYGHTAVFDPGPENARKPRMLVFGGRMADHTLADDKVYALDLWPVLNTAPEPDVAEYRWTIVHPGGTGSPLPRYRHTAVFQNVDRGPYTASWKSRMIITGGQGASALLNDVWALCRDHDTATDSYTWAQWTLGGTPPPGRYRHSAIFDPQFQRLLVYGGDRSFAEPADLTDELWALPLPNSTTCVPAGPETWQVVNAASVSAGPRAGHTAVYYDFNVTSRLVERYDPNAAPGSRWTSLSGAPRFDRWTYPFLFLLPSGNVFYAGRNTRTILSESSAPYSENTNGTAVLNLNGTPSWNQDRPGLFPGTSAIMYRPGKIMKCGRDGGRQTGEEQDPTAWVDLSAPGSEGAYTWTDDAGKLPEQRMLRRAEQNLTMLPTGDVLVTGGRLGHGDHTEAEPRAQIWNPGLQEWTTELASDPSERGYHATAILLPDGRIMGAGGNTGAAMEHEATVYEPPYLFDSDGSLRSASQRPQITGLPAQISPGQLFTVCVSTTENIASVALVRPGATTHAFNQDQRYVPLTFQKAPSGPPRLFVTAPGHLNHAPAGDYLLFVVDSTSTSLAGRVPSVGRWIGMKAPTGNDLCDDTPGNTLTDLTPDFTTSTSVFMTWTATADDANLVASGPSKQFLIRRAASPIDTEAEWDIAQNVGGLPVPGPFGTLHEFSVESLQPCTTYHFALRAEDDRPQLSGFPDDVIVGTLCGGPGGGGGYSARQVGGGEGNGSPATGLSGSRVSRGRTFDHPLAGDAMSASGSALQPALGTLVSETRRWSDGRWRITLRLATPADGLDPTASDVTVEREGETGGRDTLGRFTPATGEDLLGLCALRERGRVAVPGFVNLDRVMPHVRQRSQEFTLSEADHSRLGRLGDEFVASGGSVELLAGDVLQLTYDPAAARNGEPASWYAVVRREGASMPIPFSRRDEPVERLPQQFALHQNEPNPAGAPTVIRFDLPRESPVRLEVFDLLGRRLATVAEGVRPAGRHAVTWDLRDGNGTPVRAGVYVYRLAAGEFRAQRKAGVLP